MDWMKTTQFVIFCVSCVAGVMIWFFAQQDKTTLEISQNYATKFEVQLMQKELENKAFALEAGAFGKEWGRVVKNNELALPSLAELMDGLFNWYMQ